MSSHGRTSDIVGVIPAAGKGSRISPLPGSKELFPVGFTDGTFEGQPRRHPKVISQFLVEQMLRAGARRVIMTISPHKVDILQYYRSGAYVGVPVAYTVQEEPWGMPYALDLAYPWLREQSLTLFGMPDTVFGPPDVLSRVAQRQRESGADVMLALFPTDTPWRFGMVELDEAGGVVAIIDKPAESSLRYLWGAACWNYRFATFMHDALPATRPEQEIVLGDLFQRAMAEGLEVAACPFPDGIYLDIGSPEGLQRVMEYSRQHELGQTLDQPLFRGLEGNAGARSDIPGENTP
jgi:glucose-1-phosphate thymidylyltransferase